MNKDYLERNAKGYEGDTFVHEEIRKLVEKFSIDKIIETGTYKGATTKRLSEFAPVHSIEFDQQNYSESRTMIMNAQLKHSVAVIKGDSGKMLKDLSSSNHTLYFLDAHWHEAWPLLDELWQIKELGVKPVIIIHDFKVPGKDFGFDSYKGKDLDFDYIKAGIEQIYGPEGYDFHYNDQADGAKRGLIYIYPKTQKRDPVADLIFPEETTA
jgi:hypothetical protein